MSENKNDLSGAIKVMVDKLSQKNLIDCMLAIEKAIKDIDNKLLVIDKKIESLRNVGAGGHG